MKYLDRLLNSAAAAPANSENPRPPDLQNLHIPVSKVLKVPLPGVVAQNVPAVITGKTPETLRSIRDKIEAIEAEAVAQGWQLEQLWNARFWHVPRGLAAVLDECDEIAEVTADHILILKYERHLVRFQRINA